jgi:hypothetical protein
MQLRTKIRNQVNVVHRQAGFIFGFIVTELQPLPHIWTLDGYDYIDGTYGNSLNFYHANSENLTNIKNRVAEVFQKANNQTCKKEE